MTSKQQSRHRKLEALSLLGWAVLGTLFFVLFFMDAVLEWLGLPTGHRGMMIIVAPLVVIAIALEFAVRRHGRKEK